MNYLITSILTIIGFALGVIIMIIISKAGLNRDKQKAKLILEEANIQAKNSLKQALLDGKSQVYDLKLKLEKEIESERSELRQLENNILRKEDSLNFQLENLKKKEQSLDDRIQNVQLKTEHLEKMEEELKERIDAQISVLEKAASLSVADAKKEIMTIVEARMQNEIATYIKDKEEEAQNLAEDNARELIALAIQNIAQDEAIEKTVAVINLPKEEMKGRIIGREGRNIRSLEQATGVDLIIDDTPEAITISCFNPIRREIARLSLEALIKDGRIQPTRIEEIVNKQTENLEKTIQKAGEEAVFKLGISKINKELVKLIGRMKYRYSYGQNQLTHAMEVARIAGIMAAELGLNQQLAKRAGLLHDIGKALDFEIDGTHVELGAKIARKYGENDIVINAIESHHGDVPAKSVIATLVAAADTLSAARPGSRNESIKNYIHRLESLEAIATSFPGVMRSFAIQAGRELRVIVCPEQVDDVNMTIIAREIKNRIENELTYPGQIKIVVIREIRSNEVAK